MCVSSIMDHQAELCVWVYDCYTLWLAYQENLSNCIAMRLFCEICFRTLGFTWEALLEVEL